MSTTSRENGRLRKHPVERFSQPVRKMNLEARFDELIEEDHAATDGHRQVTISHEDGLTQTLFYFDEGSGLRDHTVQGTVTIHVIDGHLSVNALGETHEVESGELLTLERGVTHGVAARADSKMLLMVHLGPDS